MATVERRAAERGQKRTVLLLGRNRALHSRGRRGKKKGGKRGKKERGGLCVFFDFERRRSGEKNEHSLLLGLKEEKRGERARRGHFPNDQHPAKRRGKSGFLIRLVSRLGRGKKREE